MEKVASVLWKPADASYGEFAQALLALAPELASRGAAKLRINVVDDDVAAGEKSRYGSMDPPKDAVVFFWLPDADLRGPVEERLVSVSSRVESFLVVESVPIENTTHPTQPGERSYGFNEVTCIERKAGLPYDEFIRFWHNEHKQCASETQSTFAYVRNEIVRAFSKQAPSWDAIVEESFPPEALADQREWYDWQGDEERFKKTLQWMVESCQQFRAMDKVESHPRSEYVFEP